MRQLLQFASCFRRVLQLSKDGHIQISSPTMSVRRRGETKQTNGSASGTVKAASNAAVDPKTDHTRWRLRNDDGRQTWHYLEFDEELKAWPMSAADKYYLGMDTVSGGSASLSSTQTVLSLIVSPGSPNTRQCKHSFASSRERPGVLLAFAARTRQLGLRVRRAHVSAPRSRHHSICDRQAIVSA